MAVIVDYTPQWTTCMQISEFFSRQLDPRRMECVLRSALWLSPQQSSLETGSFSRAVWGDVAMGAAEASAFLPETFTVQEDATSHHSCSHWSWNSLFSPDEPRDGSLVPVPQATVIAQDTGKKASTLGDSLRSSTPASQTFLWTLHPGNPLGSDQPPRHPLLAPLFPMSSVCSFLPGEFPWSLLLFLFPSAYCQGHIMHTWSTKWKWVHFLPLAPL